VIEDAAGAVLARGLRARYGPMLAASPELRYEVLGRHVVDHARVSRPAEAPGVAVVGHRRILR
jgi:hypothetical protein